MELQHLYVHVPFCDNICSYCDFFRVKTNDTLIKKWLQALKNEIDQKAYPHLKTIYIGGGTPSSLDAESLDVFLKMLDVYVSNDLIEYTFEANPESLTEEKIIILKKHHINRISLGVQTLDEKLLKLLNRNHTTNDVLNVINLLVKHGITNISIDMMYALPYQTEERFINDLKEVASWPIKHISIYSLTIEEHSEFGRLHYEAIDNEIEGIMYEEAIEVLEALNFKQYEIASFCKEGYESKHNCCYWESKDYGGISCGAVSTINHERITNTHNINDYINGIIVSEIEELNDKDLRFEMIMLGLRMRKGLCISDYNKRFKSDLTNDYKTVINKYLENSYLIIENGYLKTTIKGMIMLHSILVDFLD